MEKNVYLTGFMGSGKTTVGPALASRMGVLFVDLDRMIEADAGMEIPLIFSTYGEPRFRELEAAALARCAALQPRVVALGGGALLRPGNLEAIRAAGKLVYLMVELPILIERLKRGKARRPLLASLTDDEVGAKVTAMMEDRAPIYEQADIVIRCGRRHSAEVAEEIEAAL